jgi:hypothetical protein
MVQEFLGHVIRGVDEPAEHDRVAVIAQQLLDHIDQSGNLVVGLAFQLARLGEEGAKAALGGSSRGVTGVRAGGGVRCLHCFVIG